MPLKRIDLTNFKKHTDLGTDFSDGLNLVVGANYSGKSTLLQAVLYALFGSSAVPGGAKAVKTHGKRNRPVVALEFSAGGHDYVVSRSGSSAKLMKDGNTEASGQSVVTKSVESLLGMSAKTFSLLRTSPQDESQAILTLGSAKLGVLVNEVTRIDIIDSVIALAKSQIPADGEQEIQSTEELESQVATLLSSLNRRQQLLEELKSSYESLTNRRTAAESAFNAYQSAYLGQQACMEKRSALRARKNEIDRRIAELGVIPSPPEEALESAKAAHATASNQRYENDRLLHEIAENEKTINDLQIEYAQSDALLSKLRPADQSLLADLKNLVNENQGTLNTLYEKKSSLASEYERVNSTLVNSVCATCHRPFDTGEDLSTLKREHESLSEKLQHIESEIVTATETLKKSNADLITAENSAAEYSRQKSCLEHTSMTISELEQSIADKRTRLTSSPTDAEVAALLNTVQDLAEKVRSYKAMADEAGNLTKEMERIREDLDTLLVGEEERTVEELSALKTALDTAKEEEAEVASTYSQQSSEYGSEYKRWEESNTMLEEVVARNVAAAALNKRYGLLRKLVKYLRKNRDRFTEDTWNSLLTYATEFANVSTNGDIVAVTRSSDGEFQFDEGRGPQPIIGASGVQKAILGVGVRLALAEALNSSTDFMLLDEVTAGATDDISLSMTRALSASGLQIISVTHRDADASIADKVIEVT